MNRDEQINTLISGRSNLGKHKKKFINKRICLSNAFKMSDSFMFAVN